MPMDPQALAALMQSIQNDPTQNAIYQANQPGAPDNTIAAGDPQIADPFGSGPQFAPAPDGSANLGFLGPGFDQAPTTSPSTSPVSSAPQTAPQSGSVSVSAGQSRSQKGFSADAYKTIEKGPRATLDRKIAEGQAKADQPYDQIIANEADAAQQRKDAEDQAFAATQMKIGLDSEYRQKIADSQALYVAKTNAAQAAAELKTQADLANYKKAQADFAASSVRPNALFEDASGFNQFGMGMAAFVHDFLGAKGIKTSAMDTLNGAIKRNVDAQISNIHHKGEVAAGFKEIWDMQRAQSATEQEAKARMHGFALTAAEMEFQSKMGAYDSKLAGAKHMEGLALIQQAQNKNDLDIVNHRSTANNQIAANESQIYGHQLAAAATTAAASIHANAAIKVAELGKPPRQRLPPPPGVPIYDQTQAIKDKDGNLVSGGGLIMGRIKPELSGPGHTELVNKIVEGHNHVQTAVRQLKEIEAMQAQQDPKLPMPDKWQKEFTRRTEALRTTLLNTIIYDSSGKQINEEEAKRFEKILPSKDFMTNGTNRQILYQTLDQLTQKEQMVLSSVMDPISKQKDPATGELIDPRAGEIATAGNSFNGPGQLEANLISSGKGEKPDPHNPVNLVPHAQYAMARPDHNESAAGSTLDSELSKPEQLDLQSKWEAVTHNPDQEKPTVDFLMLYRLAREANAGDKEAAAYLDSVQQYGTAEPPQKDPSTGNTLVSAGSGNLMYYAKFLREHAK